MTFTSNGSAADQVHRLATLPGLGDIAAVVASALDCQRVAIALRSPSAEFATFGCSAIEHRAIAKQLNDLATTFDDYPDTDEPTIRQLLSTPDFAPQAVVRLPLDACVPAIVVAATSDAMVFDQSALQALATVVTPALNALVGQAKSVLYEQVLNTLGEAVLVADSNDQVIWTNAATASLFAVSPVGMALHDLDITAHRHLEERIAPLIDPAQQRLNGTVRTYRDITDRVEQRDRLEQLVNTDPLTNVPNRRHFMAALRRRLSVSGVSTSSVLCLIDLDRFKTVNDTLGHKTGDDLLVEVAQLLSQQFRDSGVTGRLGGDEFAVLLDGAELRSAKRQADEFLDSLYRRMRNYQDERSRVTASIGMTTLRRDDSSPAAPLHRADVACYAAKRAGGSCVRARS